MQIDVYTRYDPPCSYCMATKAHLNKERIQFNEYVVGKDLTKNELMEQFPLARTLPVILIDGKVIGGAKAFVIIWSKIPKYNFLAKILSFKPLFFLFHYAYEFVAYFLFLKNKHQLNEKTKPTN